MAGNRSLYSVVDKLLDNGKEVVLPTTVSDVELANKFQQYFGDKVDKICTSITPSSSTKVRLGSPPTNVTPLAVFKPATVDEIKSIAMSYTIKCSPEGPIPACILKQNVDIFIPYWLDIVNLSLQLGSMDALKSAIIFPFIKEIGSLGDKENLKNYRPVSNLQFVGKLVERVVDNRLQKHLSSNNLNSTKQFGYKKDHSTKTLLLKIVNKLLTSFDNNIPCVVLLLDLSAAFDTVNHKKLLDILYCDLRVVGTAYEWFKSFLTNRTLHVKIGEAFSDEASLPFHKGLFWAHPSSTSTPSLYINTLNLPILISMDMQTIINCWSNLFSLFRSIAFPKVSKNV